MKRRNAGLPRFARNDGSLKVRRRTSPAFTIVELLIVIVVIAVLAAITVVSYIGISNNATRASLQADLSTVAQTLKLDYVDNDGYPESLAAANGGRGINSSDNVTYTYEYDNFVTPQIFCVAARSGNITYHVTDDTSPSVGGCVNEGVATSGLVLNLDSGDKTSYPGSGTTWVDLTSNANNVTLSNGPTYSSDGGGSIVFDGANDYANFYAPNLSATTTVEMWAKLNDYYGMMFGWFGYDLFLNNGNLGYNLANSDVFGINSSTVSSLGLVGGWKHYVFEMRSDVSYANNKIYINGVSQALIQAESAEGPGSSRNFNGGKGRISGWLIDDGYHSAMSVAVFRVYNRALTQAEITSNYNALKARFN